MIAIASHGFDGRQAGLDPPPQRRLNPTQSMRTIHNHIIMYPQKDSRKENQSMIIVKLIVFSYNQLILIVCKWDNKRDWIWG